MKELIERTKNKINNNRSHYETNEQAVREQLIAPILNKLGWDTTDPDYIKHNNRIEKDIPDYTLYKNGELVTFIEAKKITQSLNNDISQLARYCTNKGVEYGIITNGLIWILFKSFEKGKEILDRKVWEIDLSKDSLIDIENRLSTIAFDNIDNIPVLVSKIDTLDKIWARIIDNPMLLKNAFIDIFKNHLSDTELSVDTFELESFVTGKLDNFGFKNQEIHSDTISKTNSKIESKIMEKHDGKLLGTTAGDWEFRPDLGEGIFTFKSDKSKRIDVKKTTKEVSSQLELLGLKTNTPTAIGGFRYDLRIKAGILK
ncbi:MAG: type I restriction endonuclease [Bacteroidota bacterium]